MSTIYEVLLVVAAAETRTKTNGVLATGNTNLNELSMRELLKSKLK
jgi:hypothetical protein